MYAVIETHGRQFTVREGDVIRVDGSPAGVNEHVVFDRVLLGHDGQELLLGAPLLSGVQVQARVMRRARAVELAIFHYKAKKRIRKRAGHRQPASELRIEKIIFS